MYLSILIISLFAFVMSMIGTLKSYFGRRWQWFLLLLLCVLVSGTCTTIELYQFLSSQPPSELPLVIRNPINPL